MQREEIQLLRDNIFYDEFFINSCTVALQLEWEYVDIQYKTFYHINCIIAHILDRKIIK